MNKKLIIIELSIIVVLISQNIQGDLILSNDLLDQHQTDYDGYNFSISFFQPPGMPELELFFAQSFIPQKEILTRVRLLMCKDPILSPTQQCTLTIKDNLTGNILALKSLESDTFPFHPNYQWIEFDIDDIPVIIGQTYYIIVSTEPDETLIPKFYYWGGNSSNAYSNGVAYAWNDTTEEWDNETLLDTCFETYGSNFDIPALSIESINGGIGFTTVIKNTGSANSTNVSININISGGLFLNQTRATKTIETLGIGELKEITLNVRGIGLGILSDKPIITVTVNATNVDTIKMTKTALIMGRIIIIR